VEKTNLKSISSTKLITLLYQHQFYFQDGMFWGTFIAQYSCCILHCSFAPRELAEDIILRDRLRAAVGAHQPGQFHLAGGVTQSIAGSVSCFTAEFSVLLQKAQFHQLDLVAEFIYH